MKKYAVLLAVFLLALLLTACGQRRSESEMLRLFYPVDEPAAGGDILDSVSVDWQAQAQMEPGRQLQQVITLLQNSEARFDFSSPLPKNTELLGCTVSNGLAVLNFSEPFARLSGLDLTIADYCIVLTAAQIPGVRQVQITVNGIVPEGWQSTFTTDDVLLTSPEDIVKAVTVTLYFPDEAGILQPEQQELLIYEGEDACSRVLDALKDGPTDETLRSLLPEAVSSPSVWQEDEICFVNFSKSDFRILAGEASAPALVVAGITNSLCSLDGIEQMQFLSDGIYRARLGTVDISQPLSPS